jgi:leucyl aminopeptidase (aminopeptidase T)
MSKEASILVNKAYRVEKGESVLVLTDDEHMQEAVALASAVRAADAIPAVLNISASVLDGMLAPGIPEAPKHVAAAVENADVTMISVIIDYAHRFAHTAAVKHGVEKMARIASVEEGLGSWGLTEDDIHQVHDRTLKLRDALRNADKIHATTKFGTDITLSIKGRPPLIVTPIREKGVSMGPLPLWGELTYAAIEDSANGKIVVDGLMNVVAPSGFKQPIEIYVKNGRAYEIKGGDEATKLRNIIEKGDSGANVIAEFAVGTGHKEISGTLQEKGRLGTMHIALGDNSRAYPGGQNVSGSHIDSLMRSPTIEVDGKLLIRDGNWIF